MATFVFSLGAKEAQWKIVFSHWFLLRRSYFRSGFVVVVRQQVFLLLDAYSGMESRAVVDEKDGREAPQQSASAYQDSCIHQEVAAS